MLHLLPRVVVPGRRLPAFAANVALPDPLHMDENDATGRHDEGLFYRCNAKALNPQKRCETSGLHLMWPPCVRYKEITASDVLFFQPFSPTLSCLKPYFLFFSVWRTASSCWGFKLFKG